MKLIIDIPEKDYEEIMADKKHQPRILSWSDRLISNGIPLDKIKSEVLTIPQINSDGHNNNWYREPQAIIDDVIEIIDRYIGDTE